MVSQLILVRHGKACKRSESLPDEARRLTHAWQRACNAWFARKLPGLMEDHVPTIWTSPALRAMQTAEALSHALGDAPIEVQPELYEANGPEVLAALAQASGCVAIVGHNPFLSDFGACLDNACPPLGKGTAAAFSLEASAEEGATTLDARLEWLVQGPDCTRWKTLMQLEDALKVAAQRVEACEAALSANPDDVETLHKYRISLRIARSLVVFLSCYTKRSWSKKTQAALKELQAPTSLVREMDILLGVVEPGSTLAMLVTRERYDVRIEFMRKLQNKATRKTLRRALRLLARPQWRDATESRGIGHAELGALLSERLAAQEARVGSLDFGDREAVHDVRKQAKLLRYAAREFAKCLPEDACQVSDRMRNMQSQLGELCDAWVNEELLMRLYGENELTATLIAAQRERAAEIVAGLRCASGSQNHTAPSSF